MTAAIRYSIITIMSAMLEALLNGTHSVQASPTRRIPLSAGEKDQSPNLWSNIVTLPPDTIWLNQITSPLAGIFLKNATLQMMNYDNQHPTDRRLRDGEEIVAITQDYAYARTSYSRTIPL